MGYRSLKRYLGETNIERKCRLLFGGCLFLLISLTFYAVDRIAEGLINEVPRRIGQDYANLWIYDIHWSVWQTNEEFEELAKQLRNDFITEHYQGKVLAPNADEIEWFGLKPGEPPKDEAERQLLLSLYERSKLQVVQVKAPTADEPAVASQHGAPSSSLFQSANSVYDEVFSAEDSMYYFYMPIVWTDVCIHCHGRTVADSSQLMLSATDSGLATPPFRALKVGVPYMLTKNAVIWTRSLLIALAISAVGLAMLGLYVIVRYVVVKPLNHLRDVSDEISRGNTSMRAEIHTNDEFEELGTAFNKMLRHLTDAQDQLKDVNADLDGRLDQLAQLNMRLYEMNRLKDDFLANMSHELRTPLNSIIGFSDVLQGIDSLNEKQKRYAQNIQISGRNLLELINDILDLAKMEAGKMDVRLTEFRIDPVINAQCEMVRPLTDEKNIDLIVDVAAELPVMYQDQSKVQQILTNLLSNAIKFTPEGGRINVSARRTPAGTLDILVVDTGVGIAEEDREVIFEKFRQSRVVSGNDGMTRAYSGTGLGLSIVRELCNLLGGDISVESELGKGSTFRVELPWILPNRPQLESRISATLNELTKPRRELTAAGADV